MIDTKSYAQIRCAYSSVSCNECPERVKKLCSILIEFHRVILLPEVKPILVKETQAEQAVIIAENRAKAEALKKQRELEKNPTVPSPQP